MKTATLCALAVAAVLAATSAFAEDIGRYQLVTQKGSNEFLFTMLLDTATGRVWVMAPRTEGQPLTWRLTAREDAERKW
jgi:hypothetical protein